VPLRILAVVSNVLFGLYGVLADLYPVFFLHCLSRWAALLTGLVFAVPTLGPTIAKAQADLSDAANLYPGRYAAVCTPAPMFGCVCTRDPRGRQRSRGAENLGEKSRPRERHNPTGIPPEKGAPFRRYQCVPHVF
jgi:hypothetical protein